jgi:hypothetical protein
VEPSPATIDWSQIPLVFPLKDLFEMDWFWLQGSYALGIAAFLIRFDYYSLTKVLKENRSSAGRFQVYWRWGKLAPFLFFQHHCVQLALYSASELQNIIEHEKCSEQNHSIDVLLTRLFSILFWFNPVIWFTRKRFSKIWIHRGQWSLIENFRQKSLSNHALK